MAKHNVIACRRLALIATAVVAFAFAGSSALAQSGVGGRPCGGTSGFVIRDRTTGRTVTRGWTRADGTLPDGLVLGANHDFTITVASGANNHIGTTSFRTGDNGTITQIPRIQVGDSIDRDSDGDGVPDDIEDVFGLDPHNPSTVGGGIQDKLIVNSPPPPGSQPGTVTPTSNPAFGPPGIVTAVALAGTCVDVTAFNDTIGLACLDRGAAVFNVFGGLTPRLIALVDTPGEARAVSIGDTRFLAVADGPAGLAIIDISDPAKAQLMNQVPLGSYAEAVASSGGIAYVGLRSGQLVAVDLQSATEIQRLNLGAEVYDVFVSGDYVWAVSGNTLRVFSVGDGRLVALSEGGAVDGGKLKGIVAEAGNVGLSQVGPDSISGRKRLFVGGGRAQVTCLRGYDDVDVRSPSAMFVAGHVPSTGPGSFKHIVSNGNGAGLATVGVTVSPDPSHDVYLYNLTDPTKTTDLLTTLHTPGVAYANVIYNGLDYVADGASGLQVVRYLDTDRAGKPPVVTLVTSAGSSGAEESKLLRITANATDDVQVRNVEFYVDGILVATDGNFPFEIFVKTPPLTPAKTSLTLRARAFDTGGNSSWTDLLNLSIVPDHTPPLVTATQPAPNVIQGQTDRVLALFNEPLRADTVRAASFTVRGAGADGIFGTSDDIIPTGGTLIYEDGPKAVVWSFASPLPPGRWRATLAAPLADRAGNVIAAPFQWTFTTFDQPDRDHDGVPDAIEAALGTDPNNPDSRGDGIRDGDRDFDNDGLSNSFEILWGFDPKNAHSRSPTILDGDLDSDGDALSNKREQLAGTNPFLADTDGDGWNDEAEIAGAGDPLDPNSLPRFWVIALPPVKIGLSQFSLPSSGGGVFVANPPIKIGLGTFSGGLGGGVVVALPPIKIGLPVQSTDVAGGVTVALPPVKIGLTGVPDTGLGVTVAQPPVAIKFNTQ